MSIDNLPFRKCVIGIMSAKGGVGKSTHTYNLAIYFHHVLKKNVLVLDVEKNRGLSDIKYLGEREPNLKLDIKHYFQSQELRDDIEMWKMRYDIILLDTAGADADINSDIDSDAQEAMNEAALAAADFVLVPCKPSALDARKTVRYSVVLTKWLMARHNGFGILSFLNEARMNENVSVTAYDQLKTSLKIPFREEIIPYSPYIAEAMLNGLAMFQYKPKHPTTTALTQLADEVMNLTQEVLAKREG